MHALMERHRCKLCNRRFTNGRALGGHMRSHVFIPPPKAAGAASPSDSSSSFPANLVADEKPLYAGLRENSRKSSSSVVQDGVDSDAESPLLRRPLKRPPGCSAASESSVSDASPEEDVALCLMLLSRDSWSNNCQKINHDDDEDDLVDDEDYDDDEDLAVAAKLRRKKTAVRCGTCRKIFRSYQALGGHRASHKRVGIQCLQVSEVGDIRGGAKVFECPYCDRVFPSGQALGGHKRSHFATTAGRRAGPVRELRRGIDLNLPAPLEDDEELSAVSFTAAK